MQDLAPKNLKKRVIPPDPQRGRRRPFPALTLRTAVLARCWYTNAGFSRPIASYAAAYCNLYDANDGLSQQTPHRDWNSLNIIINNITTRYTATG